jgi:XTP/dITP diphosphohydrolase
VASIQTKLLIGTRNQGKILEYQHLFQELPFQLMSLDDLGIDAEVDETGQTFLENAWLKANTYASLSGLLTLSDDSGLEVDALGGEPGIHSARYGVGAKCLDPPSSDCERVALLLKNLADVPWPQRTARFLCVIVMAFSPAMLQGMDVPYSRTIQQYQPGQLASVVGSVSGMIQYQPQGDKGFGYDPVFYLPSFERTMAQIDLEDKNRISHRSDAVRKAAQVLRNVTGLLEK